MSKSENIAKQITSKISIISLIIGIILLLFAVSLFMQRNNYLNKVKDFDDVTWKEKCNEYNFCMKDNSDSQNNPEEHCRIGLISGVTSCNYKEYKAFLNKKYIGYIYFFIGSISCFMISFIFKTKNVKK